MLQFNALYRSNPQSHVRFVAGERKEEVYYLYYLLRPDGIWLSKTVDSAALDLEEFLMDIDLAEVLADPDHDEPTDERQELFYQCGTWEANDGYVYFNWKHSQLEEKQRRWYFRIEDQSSFVSDFGEFEFYLIN